MSKSKLLELLKAGAGVIIGVGAHHYGGKVLDSQNIKAENAAQAVRDGKLDNYGEAMISLNNKIDKCINAASKTDENLPISKEDYDTVRNSVEEIQETAESIKNLQFDANNTDILDQKIEVVKKASNNIIEVIERWSKGNGNNFLPDFNIQNLYDFLDSLTLLEESAFLHITIFILILSCLFSIVSVFFGNEIIKYFKLEERFPRLELFFKLRAKFQRYYLIWNILIIVAVSLIAIFLNLIVLI